MIVRVCCLILLGALELAWPPLHADEGLPSPAATEEVERLAGFEVAGDSVERHIENAGIFTPLSPITVESESVKLPEDQEID